MNKKHTTHAQQDVVESELHLARQQSRMAAGEVSHTETPTPQESSTPDQLGTWPVSTSALHQTWTHIRCLSTLHTTHSTACRLNKKAHQHPTHARMTPAHRPRLTLPVTGRGRGRDKCFLRYWRFPKQPVKVTARTSSQGMPPVVAPPPIVTIRIYRNPHPIMEEWPGEG